jgi:hypothetical protein
MTTGASVTVSGKLIPSPQKARTGKCRPRK